MGRGVRVCGEGVRVGREECEGVWVLEGGESVWGRED